MTPLSLVLRGAGGASVKSFCYRAILATGRFMLSELCCACCWWALLQLVLLLQGGGGALFVGSFLLGACYAADQFGFLDTEQQKYGVQQYLSLHCFALLYCWHSIADAAAVGDKWLSAATATRTATAATDSYLKVFVLCW